MSGPILPLPSKASGKQDGKEQPVHERTALREVARSVLRRCRQQEFVVPREIREELVQAGLAANLWKEVVNLAGSSLSHRHGRYYYVPVGRSRMQVRIRHGQHQQGSIHRAVRALLRRQRGEDRIHRERRAHKRHDFNRPVLVQTEDNSLFQFVTREISLSGMRLICNRSLQGQKLRVWLTFETDRRTYCFRVCILWSAAVADNLHENGGVLLEFLDEEPHPLQLADEGK
jgi:hypothetical protein